MLQLLCLWLGGGCRGRTLWFQEPMTKVPQGSVLVVVIFSLCLYTIGLYLLLRDPVHPCFWRRGGVSGAGNMPFSSPLTVTPRILKAMSERQAEFTSFKRIQIAMGTWNVNGGKQFRSNLLGAAELADWLLDAPRLPGVDGPQGECSPLGKLEEPICRCHRPSRQQMSSLMPSLFQMLGRVITVVDRSFLFTFGGLRYWACSQEPFCRAQGEAASRAITASSQAHVSQCH